MLKIPSLLAAAVLATGCASIVNDSSQPMKLETRRADGTLVTGARCQLSNDRFALEAASGGTVQVRRSSVDLAISCQDPAHPEATGRAISRANAGLAGNILFGGGIGAIIDHSRGTAYTYPGWVRLTFGQSLVFDRSAEREGEPVLGAEPVAAR